MKHIKWYGISLMALLLLMIGIDAEANGFRTVQQVNSSALVVKEQDNSTSKTLATLLRGDFVTIYSTIGEWSKIELNGHFGYVKSVFLTKPASSIKIANSKGGLVVKASPEKSAKTLSTLQYNMIVEDFGVVAPGWSFVQYGNVTGYVATSFTGQPATTKRFIQNEQGEPVRNIASPSGYIKETLASRMKVTVHSTIAGWSYVTQGQVRGYVRASQLIDNLDAWKPTYLRGILIVNKDYPLPKSYNPGVDANANTALNRMVSAANKAGYRLTAFSHFRSYSYQNTLFNNYVKRDGLAAAERYSARPGHSEHQSGLAFDIGEVGRESLWLTAQFGTTPAGKWLANNAQAYGFILRYPQGKEKSTGYMHESWHFRYVGIEIAQEIKAANITLEEYLGI